MSEFQKQYSFEKRIAESKNIRRKYPDRIPIIVESSDTNIPKIDKKKFLVPNDITCGQFLYVIRKRIKLNSEKALFLFINNRLPPSSSLMSTIDTDNVNKDGFLYIQYSGENTFG